MKKGSPIKLIALLAAVLAIAAMYLTLSSYRQSAEVEAVPTQVVALAAQDLASGTTLTADMLTIREVPVTEVMPGAVIDPTQALGQKTNQHIYSGEQIIADKLGGSGCPISCGRGCGPSLCPWRSKPAWRASSAPVIR